MEGNFRLTWRGVQFLRVCYQPVHNGAEGEIERAQSHEYPKQPSQSLQGYVRPKPPLELFEFQIHLQMSSSSLGNGNGW